MQKPGLFTNPFALMMDPQAVLDAIEGSERLKRLHSRICRPLDKPLIPLVRGEDASSMLDDDAFADTSAA